MFQFAKPDRLIFWLMCGATVCSIGSSPAKLDSPVSETGGLKFLGLWTNEAKR
jgi:hypothetical protein